MRSGRKPKINNIKRLNLRAAKAIGLKISEAFLLRADEVIEGAAMSAIGPKRTSLVAPHMSAIGGKAGLLRRTCRLFDPKRTLTGFSASVHNSAKSPLFGMGRADARPGYSILASVGKLARHAGPERVASNP